VDVLRHPHDREVHLQQHPEEREIDERAERTDDQEQDPQSRLITDKPADDENEQAESDQSCADNVNNLDDLGRDEGLETEVEERCKEPFCRCRLGTSAWTGSSWVGRRR
jgi:hypothetical protein